MRKLLVILVLAASTLGVSAGDAFAQFRGGYGGGGYRGGYGGYGGGSGYGLSIGNGGVRFYSGSNYGSPYYGRNYYSPGYSYGAQYGSPYYNSAPIIQVPAAEYRPSYYYEPTTYQQTATMVVLVPRADALVWFDGSLTSQQGMNRTFSTPALNPGTYSYTIRSRWMDNGQMIERERRITVQPGQSFTVNFRDNG